MKIERDRSIVEFIPETEEETLALQSIWDTVIDCSNTSSHLVPIGEYVPRKKNTAQFYIEKPN